MESPHHLGSRLFASEISQASGNQCQKAPFALIFSVTASLFSAVRVSVMRTRRLLIFRRSHPLLFARAAFVVLQFSFPVTQIENHQAVPIRPRARRARSAVFPAPLSQNPPTRRGSPRA